MFNKEVLEKTLQEEGIAREHFFEQGNRLSFGGLRGMKELEAMVKIMSNHLHYEKVRDDYTIEEWGTFLARLLENEHIVGWFVSGTEKETNLWYAPDDEIIDAIDLAGGIQNLMKMN